MTDLLVEVLRNVTPAEARAVWHALAATIENEETDGDPDHPNEHHAPASALCARLDAAMIKNHLVAA